jgi:hypothetical protein
MSIKIDYKISDILHDAADNELAHNQETYWCSNNTTRKASLERFSCCAIDNAVINYIEKKYPDLHWSRRDRFSIEIFEEIKEGLRAMGLNTELTDAFGKEPDDVCPEIQGQRYFWLKWAALMAEEQGV